MVDKLREAGRMAERGADNIFHELVRDPNWQPTRADYTSIGHLLRNIAGTAGNRATAANGEQAERDKLKTAYFALLKISQDDHGPIGRYAAKIARAVESDATPTQDARERVKVLEEAAQIAENPGFIEARDTEWDAGVNFAKRFIAKAIRARTALGNKETDRHG